MAVGWTKEQVAWLQENNPDRLAQGYDASGGNAGVEGGYTGTGDEYTSWLGEQGAEGVLNPGGSYLPYKESPGPSPGSPEFYNLEPEDRRTHMDALSNQMLQENYIEFKNRYLPVADSLRNWFGEWGDTQGEVVGEARQQGLAAGQTAANVAQRDISRYGMDLKTNQRDQLQKGLAMTRTGSAISAANTARGNMQDAFMAAMQDYISLGHGAAGSGLSGVLQYNQSLAQGAANEQMMGMQAQSQGSGFSSILGGLAGGAAKFGLGI